MGFFIFAPTISQWRKKENCKFGICISMMSVEIAVDVAEYKTAVNREENIVEGKYKF